MATPEKKKRKKRKKKKEKKKEKRKTLFERLSPESHPASFRRVTDRQRGERQSAVTTSQGAKLG